MKKAIAFLLFLVMLLSLTACHGNGVRKEISSPESDTPAASDTAQPAAEVPPQQSDEDAAAPDIGELLPGKQYTISFWAKNDTNKSQVNIYNHAVEAFEALYPNIHVEIQLYTDYGKIYNDVITNIATNTTPNVCITYPDHIATYLTGNHIVAALDDYMADEKYGFGGSEVLFDGPQKDEIVSQFLQECMIDGTYYALPYMRSTEACYVNKDFVEALGYTLPETLTWDFVWEVSEAAMAKNDDGTFKLNGQNVLIPFIYKSTDNMMIQMVRQKGSGYSTSSGNILLFNNDTRELLYTIAKHAGTRAFSTFSISSYPANYLNAGQCIFAVDSTAGATWMGCDAPLLDIDKSSLVQFETVVKTIPQFDPKSPMMISQGPSVCVFNKTDPGEVIASWLFTQFLLTNDIQIAYSQTEGYVPVTLKAQNSHEYLDYLSRCGEDNSTYYNVKINASRLLLENTGNTFVTPVFNGSANLREAAGQLIEEVTKSMRRKENVDDAYMEALFAKVISMKKLDQNGLKIGEPDVLPPASPAAEEQTGLEAEQPVISPSEPQQPPKDRKDLGPLPTASIVLLISLAVVWMFIAAYYIRQILKNKQGKKSDNS